MVTGGSGDSHLGVGGAGDHIGVSIIVIIRRTTPTVGPEVIGSGLGKGNVRLTVLVDISRLCIIGIQRAAIIHGKRAVTTVPVGVRTLRDQNCGIVAALCRTTQCNGQRLTGSCSIGVRNALTIHKIVEACIGFTIKTPAGVAGDIHKIAALNDDLVGSSAPSGTGQRVLAIYIVIQIFIESKNTALKIAGTGTSCERYLIPASAVQIFVGIDGQMQRGDFIFSVAVRIISIIIRCTFTQTISGQVNRSQRIHVHWHRGHWSAVLIIDVSSIFADRKIHRACGCSIHFYRKRRGRQHP